jgi:hypothetical protein
MNPRTPPRFRHTPEAIGRPKYMIALMRFDIVILRLLGYLLLLFLLLFYYKRVKIT